MVMCECVNVDPVACLACRHKIATAMARCMGGCTCLCHLRPNGVIMTRSEWEKNKQRTYRPARPARRGGDAA
jgi:hypothetical protein